MPNRLTQLLIASVFIAGCASSAPSGERAKNAFEMVDLNRDGQVDIEEFRQQMLFPPYEQYFVEADEDDSGTLDPEEFETARSLIYAAMGVGGANSGL